MIYHVLHHAMARLALFEKEYNLEGNGTDTGQCSVNIETPKPTSSSEEFRYRHGEARQNIIPGNSVFRGENLGVTAVVINSDGVRDGIDQPNHAATGFEPFLDFCKHIAGAIVGRKHFDRQIRRTVEKPGYWIFRSAGGREKRHVRRADRIGIMADLKAGLGGCDHSELVLFDIHAQSNADPIGDSTMLKTGRRHFDKFSTYQLAVFHCGHLEQLFGGGKRFHDNLILPNQVGWASPGTGCGQ